MPLVSRVVECGEREWAPPRKIIFIPQNEKFGCIFTQFLTGRKHGQSLEALGHGFYGSIAKRGLQKQCKNYPKVHAQTKGGRTIAPTPKYATELQDCHSKWSLICRPT